MSNQTEDIQHTVALIKPDVVAAGRVGELITEIEHNPTLTLEAMWYIEPEASFWEAFYYMIAEEPFFQRQMEFMNSGRSVALTLSGENAINYWREWMGPTDPVKAKSDQPGCLRGRYGTELPRNAVHGSDSSAEARREALLLAKLFLTQADA